MSELVSRGEIELGIVVITQILTTEGVALAGPLPSEISVLHHVHRRHQCQLPIDRCREGAYGSFQESYGDEIPGDGARQMETGGSLGQQIPETHRMHRYGFRNMLMRFQLTKIRLAHHR